MFVVIFRARIRELDAEYAEYAERLRERALRDFGCLEFESLREGECELALSWWPSLEAIAAWRDDPEHRAAQERGRSEWYREFSVEICEARKRV